MLTQAPSRKSIGSCHWRNAISRGLGIDIGQRQTKVVSVECLRGEAIKVCAATIPTIPTTAQETAGSSIPHWSSLALKQLAHRTSDLLGGAFNGRGARIAVTLSMSVCDYRTIYVPADARTRPAIIQESIASATGDLRPRCIALLPNGQASSDEANATLRCFSLPEELSWSVAQAFDEVGLTPHAINGLPWCLTNAVELISHECDPAAFNLVIDWSYGPPTLVAARGGDIDYVRCLSHGSLEELTTQPGTDYHMNFSEAQHWIGACLASPTSADALSAMADTSDWVHERCGLLAEEINTAIEYLRWRHQSAAPPVVWMMGGATLLPGLQRSLQSHLNCQIKPWTWSVGNSQLTAEYATAAALAFQELRRAQR